MAEDGIPTTSVLVDVVYVLGGDVLVNTTGALPHNHPELVERLAAVSSLLGIAHRLLHDTALSAIESGIPIDELSHITTDARNAVGWNPDDDTTLNWLRAG